MAKTDEPHVGVLYRGKWICYENCPHPDHKKAMSFGDRVAVLMAKGFIVLWSALVLNLLIQRRFWLAFVVVFVFLSGVFSGSVATAMDEGD